MTPETNKPKNRLLTLRDMAAELNVSAKSITKGRYLYDVMIHYGMFSISAPGSDKTSYRMHRKDFELAIDALTYGRVRYTGAAGTRPEPGDSQCASQPGEGSEGEPSGLELANTKNESDDN